MSQRPRAHLRAGLAVALLGALGCTAMPPPDGRLSGGSSAGLVYRIDLDDTRAAGEVDRLRLAAARAKKRLYLWLDVGRSPGLAAEHPGWVAGMGSHEDWRQRRPEAPKPGEAERIGVWPWTPIWYRSVLADRESSIVRLLRGRTGGIAGVFLSHVQGAPSACGCGNDQCRWTVDYRMPGGPEKLDESPSAALLSSLASELPDVHWIPVWVTECEKRDMPGEASTGHCGGVSCFTGACWKESTKELEGLLGSTRGPIGLLAAEKYFHRRQHSPEPQESWALAAARSLEEIPIQHARSPLPRERLVVVVEDDAAASALPHDLRSRVEGVLVGEKLFDEGWEPRLIPRVSAAKAAETPHGHP